MVEKTHRVTGMSCASCAAHVQKAVAKVPGVAECAVNIATEKMTVLFDESVTGFEQLKKTVEDAGYGLLEERPSAKRVELAGEGMTCAAALRRWKGGKKINGVKSASVNLATNKAAIEYDTAQVKLSEIKAAITNAGYSPRDVEGEAERDIESEKRQADLKNMRIRLIIAAIFSVPILYIAMGHMIPFVRLPLPHFMTPHDFPLVFALVQLALTLPVILAGSRFFRFGLKRL